MKKILTAYGIFIAFVIFVFVSGFFTGKMKREVDFVSEIQRDTLFVRDTIRLDISEPIAERKVGTMKIPIPIVAKFEWTGDLDSDEIPRDTVFIEVPRVERVYGDSTFYAVVSGYNPSLDTIILFPTKQVILEKHFVPKIEYERRRFSVGIQLGYGTDFQNFSPYIGIGIQYNLFSW